MRTAEAETDIARTGDAQRTSAPWAAPLAAAGLITAVAHLPVTGEHLEEAPYIGALFIALEAVSVLLAIAVLARPSRALHIAFSAVGALAVLALVLSRTIGLPLIADDIGNWTEPLAVVSVLAEAVMAVGGAAAAIGRPSRSARAAQAGLVAGVAILLLGAFATGVAATAAPGESSHVENGVRMEGPDMEGMHMGLPAAGAGAESA